MFFVDDVTEIIGQYLKNGCIRRQGGNFLDTRAKTIPTIPFFTKLRYNIWVCSLSMYKDFSGNSLKSVFVGLWKCDPIIFLKLFFRPSVVGFLKFYIYHRSLFTIRKTYNGDIKSDSTNARKRLHSNICTMVYISKIMNMEELYIVNKNL